MKTTTKELLEQINKDGRKIAYITYDNSSLIASVENERIARFEKWAKSKLSKSEKEISELNLGPLYRGINKRGFIIVVRTKINETFHNWDSMIKIA